MLGGIDMKELENSLLNWLSDVRKVTIIGIGNSLRRDDVVGVEAVRGLRKRVSRSVYLMECETVPESFVGPVTRFKPTHILMIDAAQLHLKQGSSKLVTLDEIVGLPMSTHAMPLKLFAEHLARTTGAKVALLAIQPKDIGFGEGLTEELKKTVEDLTSLLSKILPHGELH